MQFGHPLSIGSNKCLGLLLLPVSDIRRAEILTTQTENPTLMMGVSGLKEERGHGPSPKNVASNLNRANTFSVV